MRGARAGNSGVRRDSAVGSEPRLRRARQTGAAGVASAVWGTLLGLILVPGACLIPAPCAAQARPASEHRVEIRDASLSASAHAAALALDLNREASFRLFTLSRPGRVVLDLRESRLAPGVRLPRAGGIVETVRAGRQPHGGLRIVLQLAASAAPRGRVRLPVRSRWSRGGARGLSRLLVTIGELEGAPPVSPDRSHETASDAHAAPSEARGALDVSRDASSAARIAPRPVLAAHAPLPSDRDVVIAVDAGHGGQDPGAIGHSGTEEKNVTLAIARALAARIDAEPGMRAVLTRDSDVFLPLRERMRRAREARADLFVSVHADSVHDPEVSGASVYVLSERGATDEAARWLAERENAADRLGGISLADKGSTLASVLLDLSQTANISASMTAAQRVLAALDHVGEVRKARVQQAGFVVLKSPDIPSMLIETAYISNPADERRLRTTNEQRKLANAIFSGLLGYFEQYPPAGTRLARYSHPDEQRFPRSGGSGTGATGDPRGSSGAVLAGAVAAPAAVAP